MTSKWEINGWVIERRSENSFLIFVENESKKVVRSFRDAFLFVHSDEAQIKLNQFNEKKELKRKKMKIKN